MSDKIQFWSCGGGTQSCAIGALIVQGKLPKPDIAAIADTGLEMPTTWEYLDAVLAPALKSVGVEIHRIKKDEWATPRGKDIFATSGQLLLPAYSNMNGRPSKLSGFCSSAWKQEVIDRWLRIAMGCNRKDCVKWIGFSFDEPKRILRMQAGKEYLSGLIRFPLVHDVRLKRHEAIQLVKDMGWPTPPRSRCFMCPNQSDKEWVEVKHDYPSIFDDAVAMDERIRTRDANAFLHSSIAPLKDAYLDPREDLFSAGCPSGECFL